MHRRTLLALAAAAPLFATRAFAAQFNAPLRFDSAGRPLIDVTINDQGPFPMVLDTGAAATALTPAVVARLALQEAGRARVQGASGVQEVPLYRLDSVAVAGLRREQQMGAVLPNNPSAEGHGGVLGAGTFLNTRIKFDFAGNSFHVDDGATRAPLAGSVRTSVEFRHRTFAFFNARVDGVDARAVLDTGARRSVANAHLRTALGFAANDPRFRAVEGIGGATGHSTETFGADARSIIIAGHDFGAFEIAFAELSVFPQLGLADVPGIILGMDILRRARALTLDYSSAEMELTI